MPMLQVSIGMKKASIEEAGKNSASLFQPTIQIILLMNSEEDLTCLHCKKNFTQENPPRMLTMCGHTFCDACIKSLIVRKKINNKYKLVCPEDKTAIDLSSNNTSFFPKNIALLKILQHKSKNTEIKNKSVLSSIRLSKNDIQKLKSEESSLTYDLQENSLHDTSMLKSLAIGQAQQSFPLQQMQSQICLLHQKPLDIVCVRDCQRICPSCAIFGQHKTHQMKTLNQVEDLKCKMEKNLKCLLVQKKKILSKIHGKEIWGAVDKILDRKKKQMTVQIKKKYKNVNQMISKFEKKALVDVEKKIIETEKKIRKSLQMDQEDAKLYHNWQENALEKLSALNGSNQEEKFRFLLKPQDVTVIGEKFINSLRDIENTFVGDAQRTIDKLTLVFNFDKMNEVLSQFFSIEEYQNSFLGISQICNRNFDMKMNKSLAFPGEESLLEMDENLPRNFKSSDNFKVKDIKLSLASSKSSQLNEKEKEKADIIGNFIQSPKNMTRSSLVSNPLSPKHLIKSGGGFKGKLLKVKLQEKYEKNIANLMNGSTDTLDLTNAELGDEKIIHITESLKEKGLTVAKLGRNKLTDEGLNRILVNFPTLMMLNVSKNELSERTLDILYEVRQSGLLPSLKSIMLGQNKIVQRKCKSKIEQLKGLGINVCI